VNLDQAATATGYSVEWLAQALDRGLLRARTERGVADVPDEEVAFLTRSHRWLPHLIDAVAAEDIKSAILFGRHATPRDARARASLILTTVDDPDRALDLNGIFSTAGQHEIYVVTWSTGIRQRTLLSEAVLTGRVLRDEGLTWRRLVQAEFQQVEPSARDQAERRRLHALLEYWASTETRDD
jgi:hypothetical protein